MHYLSPEFAFAFLILLWAYWFAGLSGGVSLQNRLLLLASYGFYASFDWRFACLLAGFSLGILGLAHLACRHQKHLNALLGLGVCIAVLNLALFKYYNFFRESLAGGFALHSLPVLDIALPLGISFYTFTAIAYLVAVIKQQRPAANLADGLLYLSFFPTLLAGPICRPHELLNQIEAPQPRQLLNFSYALLLLVSALIKKMWLANWLAQSWVNPIFADPGQYQTLEVVGALFAYAWQLYFDFSGYTDLVTALALLLGFNLPINFRQPYLATSLTDFWQRWHRSLSLWIRDFIYIPLGGNRKGWLRTQINLVIAMVLSGLWHGAGLPFLLWGLWHGLGYVAQNTWRSLPTPALPRRLSQALTFTFVAFGWVLFRSNDWPSALAFCQALSQWHLPLQQNSVLLGLAIVVFFKYSQNSQARLAQLEQTLAKAAPWQQAIIVACLIAGIFALAPTGTPGFIYYGF